MDVKRFLRGSAAFGAAAFFGVSSVALIAATPLNDIPGTTEMYSAAETDARIAELGGAGDYATVSNAAVNAGWRATNYTDYAVGRLSQTNSVLSGGPYQTELPYPTNSIPYSAISDAPPAVAVVAPSTNAAAGTAADAKATGTALYTGFTPWVCVPSDLTMVFEGNHWVPYFDGMPQGSPKGDADSMSLSWTYEVDASEDISATRHLITPTKTSQLVNDGSNGVPFVVVSQIPAPVDISGKLDGAAAYPAWLQDDYEEGEIVSHIGKLWRCVAQLTIAEPSASSSDWKIVTLEELKQDKLTPTQIDYLNAVPGKVSTNALANKPTYDFSKNYDIIKATADIVQLLGGTITNNPTAQGGN